MCGIFGYVGPTSPKASRDKWQPSAAKIIFEGLKRLEYRGYDSWGIALGLNPRFSKPQITNFSENKKQKIILEKHAGSISDSLDSRLLTLNSKIGIGHTRWATHGSVKDKNAHPHFSKNKEFVLAHNGIVENFEELKKGLKKSGFEFETDTDSEVIVRLIEDELTKSKDIVKAVFLVLNKIEGRNTFIILTADGKIIAARNGSPLLIGSNDKSYFFSSDTLSFSKEAHKMLFVDNGQVAVFDSKKLRLFDAKSRREQKVKFEPITVKNKKVDKEGYAHFMLKEINESPYVLKQVVKQDEHKLKKLALAIKKSRNIYTIGSGTTGNAAAQIAYFLRANANVNAISLIGADAYEYFELFSKNDLIIAPSQSGETADVLEVLEIAKKKGARLATNVNMAGSMMEKLSDFHFATLAGPEICVVSTKVFLSHIAWGYLVSKVVAGEYKKGISNLNNLKNEIENYLQHTTQLKLLAKKLSKKEHIFLLGKAQNFQIIKEGMIKIIETSYSHAHGIPSGDLKHYAITLMEKGVPVVVAVSEDEVRSDVLNAVSQVKARGADVIALSPETNKEFDIWIKVPNIGEVTSIFNVIPLQLIAYYMAVELGNNVDKPRNIAKSVTVK